MNHLFLGALFCSLLILSAHEALSQQDSVTYRVDSAFQTTLVTTPQFSGQRIEEYGSYAVRVANPALSQAYAGISVLNTLRGQVPAFSISPSVVYAEGATIRNGGSMMLIDGMPFSSEGSYLYNLNAFDFESVSAVGNANTNFAYGAAGLRGGFFLKSKTGENIEQPSFEFNSYTSRNFAYKDPVYFEPDHSTWNFSNSFAYSQDYGAVDLRASYNFDSNPFANKGIQEGYDRAHSFKINGGLDLGKFSLRFIGDYRTQNWEQELTLVPPGSNSVQQGNFSLLQGNLLAQYKFNEWIKITSQNISSSTDIDSDYDYSFGRVHFDSGQPRRLHNLIVSVNKKLSATFTLRSFAGVQYDKVEWDRAATDDNSYSEQHYEESNTGTFAGMGAGIGELLFLDLNYRRDAFSLFPEDKPVNTWGGSASLVFSRLFSDNGAGFYGKIRSYLGKTNNDYVMSYPTSVPLPLNRPAPPSPRNSFEIGMDLGLIGNRITFSTSYCKTVQEDAWAYFDSPFSQEYFNLGDFKNSGYEFAAGFVPIATSKTAWSSNITFFKHESKIGSGSASTGDAVYLGSSIPDWNATWFNQFNYGPLFINVLLDMQRGGDFYLFDHTQTPMGTVDGSHTKLRDLSVGYSFAHSFLERMNLQAVRVSVSGRNLIQFNDKEKDAERYDVNPYLKSVSISLSVGF